MNKKAFLLAEETIKMVIALIALTFLVYFLTSLYFSNQNEKDLGLAKESLDFLVQEIQSGNKQVEIYNPSGWTITSWENNENMPKTCSNFAWKNCICICKEDSYTRRVIGLSEDCDEYPACADSNFQVSGARNWYKKELINSIVISKPFPIQLNINGNQITKNE